MRKRNSSASTVSRRSVIRGVGAATLSSLATFKSAHGLEDGPKVSGQVTERDDANLIHYAHVHEGKGVIDVRMFFKDEGYPKPALLLIYNIPPGASEGVHTHRPGDQKMGSFDEFYYIMEGRGEMEVAGRKFAVKPGDHVFTPNEVAHGIENTSNALLRVYLVAMIRD